ncbi:hypothetical protein VKT23_018038 [Stygiomarasmius scandens]|uniref:Major facilitator superfamily (MFS) profile domain-containing protein n=1 Tax=Marasmiellus scandens TaxID=2682957 RepID=A0ABR1IQA2_9AGAR
MVLGLFMMLACSFGYLTSWGVFQSYYENPSNNILKSSSSSDIAWIGSTQTAMAYFMLLLSGPICDRGHFRAALIVGCIGIVLSTFLVAECHNYWHFILCQGVLSGISIGLSSGAAPVIIPQWFRQRRGLAFGVAYAGTPIGGILIPIIGRDLFPKIGFAWTMRVFGFIFLVLSVICCILARPPSLRNTTSSDSNILHRRLFTLKGLLYPPYVAYTISTFLVLMGLYTLPAYVGTTAMSLGLSESRAFYMVSVANGGSGIGRVGGGFLADKIGSLNVQFCALIISTAMTFAWPFAKTEAALLAITLFYGIGLGTYIALEADPVARMADPGDLGRLLGVMWALGGISSLLSLPVPAKVNKVYGTKAMGFYTGSMILGGALLLLLARFLVMKKLVAKA